jgi:hypothetical protein
MDGPKAGVSHDEVLIKALRDDPRFAVEYLKAVPKDIEES